MPLPSTIILTGLVLLRVEGQSEQHLPPSLNHCGLFEQLGLHVEYCTVFDVISTVSSCFLCLLVHSETLFILTEITQS